MKENDMSFRVTPCPCGSGKGSHWQYDARNIPLCRTCSSCHSEKMKKYRYDVLTNPNYEADEAIDEDEY
jgi:hypothetical protein